MSEKLKLLIVEDEEAILRGLEDVFVFHGYDVDVSMDGQEGLDKALAGPYDCIILDVMLPNLDGFSICNEIRKHSREQPIVMLTAKTQEEDIIQGLTLGADDYISKPFSIRELLLRVEAVLRRSRKAEMLAEELILGSGLRIDTINLIATNPGNENPLQFTRREVEILRYLQSNFHRPVSRDELLENVWGYKKAANLETRTVDIHIAKIRRKIELDSKDPKLLITIRGEGYKLLANSTNT